ncbi:ATP-binding protein [Amycolatopsis sp. NPDC049252]|uniref:ATP-binding protein n=1 Tax=Amycolatopsis sp. NPDC049252 TaxID=3363933 RepID=UPI00371E914B
MRSAPSARTAALPPPGRSSDRPALAAPPTSATRGRETRANAGLGLSIVRSVAHAHGGTAEAQPGKRGGLTVTVHLPS